VEWALRWRASLMITGCFLGAPILAQTLPQSSKVTAGSATISRNSSSLTVQQSSNRAVIDWNSFSIGSGDTVSFILPNSSSVTLNRVIGSMTSVIAGDLHSNGGLYLINPNGIEISPSGVINTESFAASALALTDTDFLSGKDLFTGSGNSAAVTNQGLISVAPGGSALLIGGRVTNAGSIIAPGGTVGLAAGESVSVDLEGDRFLTVSVPTAKMALLETLITESGRIQASGGRVSLRAATTADVARSAIQVSGEIDASNVHYGSDGVDFGRPATSADGGDVSIDGGPGGAVEITGQIRATSAVGTGGTISVTGRDVSLVGATLDASGAVGGGAIRVGGDFHGHGSLPTALTTVVDGGSVLRADATASGNGGSVVVWSEDSTTDAGRISARGGAQDGSGGQVEVSSHEVLNFTGAVDLLAAQGQTGTLLLDPYNVIIQTASGTPTDTCTSGTCTPSGSNSILTVAALETALGSSNVTVTTGSAGTDAGNITVSNAVTWSSGYGLTLSATKNINVNASITSTGSGALGLTAASGAISVTSSTLSTDGGSLSLDAAGSGTANAINLSGATLAVGAGTGTITGTSTSGYGVSFTGANSFTSSGTGSFSVMGTAGSQTGLILNLNASVTDSGTLGLTGVSTSLIGLRLSGAALTLSSGSATLSGTSGSNSGIYLSSSNSVQNNGSGSVVFDATSTAYRGWELNSGASFATTGNVTVTATTSTGTGIYLDGNGTMSASAGTLNLDGTASSAGRGANLLGSNTLSTVDSGVLNISGISSSGVGMKAVGNSSLTTSGTITLTGTSNSGNGMYIQGANSLLVASGMLSIIGNSTSAVGVDIARTNILSNAGGTLSITGTSSTGNGVQVETSSSITTTGTMSIAGTSSTGYGFNLYSGDSVTASSGSLTLSGDSTSGFGQELQSSSSITNNGTGTLTLSVADGIDLNASITSTSGPVVISGSGNITQSAGTLEVNSLLLSGTSGIFTLTASGTQIGTLAANAATVTVNDESALTIGTVLGTAGVSAPSGVTLITASDLTLSSGAPVSGASPVLAAYGAFINDAGSAAVVATSGNWLIYSNTPSSDTFGALNSANTAIWNATYSSMPPANVTASGNYYVFALQPTLTFTSTGASKTYGTDATSSITWNYTTSGYQSGVTDAYLTDTAASVYSGTPSVTSAGSVSTAMVSGGPYAITVAQGSLAALNGYALSFQSTGSLTVNPATLTVTASNQSKTYGTTLDLGTTAFTETGLVNSDTLTAVTLSSPGTVATATVAGGHYAITPSNAAGTGLSNYTISYSDGALTVNPATLTGVVTAANKVYDGTTTATLTSETLSGAIYNGDASDLELTVATANFNSKNVLTADKVTATGLTLTGSAASNYELISSTAITSADITPRPLTISANPESKIYGNSVPVFTYVLGGQGLVSGDGLSGSLSAGTTSASHVGSYWIGQATLSASPNYTVTYIGNILTVDPRPLTIAANPESELFGSPIPPLTYVVGGFGLVNGDHLTGALSTIPNANATVGVYPITQGTLAATGDYTISYVDASLSVISDGWPTTGELAARTYVSGLAWLVDSAGIGGASGNGVVDRSVPCREAAALTIRFGVEPGDQTVAVRSDHADCATAWSRAADAIDWWMLAVGRTSMTKPSISTMP